ncbi:MAG: sigma-70 family RNA polymerase sigma factor [Bradymonadaceae bacterium]|nr:sigma-70 family RNA polymerase sigma factor [Lujinxingiaceae bacterium]
MKRDRKDPASEALQRLETHVDKNRDRLVNTVRRWIREPALAEDLLQEALVKALSAAEQVEDVERLEAWFHQILRNTALDHSRKEQRSREGSLHLAHELNESWEPEFASNTCPCLAEALAELSSADQDLIEKLELGEGEPTEAARELGITRNNLKVRRHRARNQLKDRLVKTCGTCAGRGCLDCTCQS